MDSLLPKSHSVASREFFPLIDENVFSRKKYVQPAINSVAKIVNPFLDDFQN